MSCDVMPASIIRPAGDCPAGPETLHAQPWHAATPVEEAPPGPATAALKSRCSSLPPCSSVLESFSDCRSLYGPSLIHITARFSLPGCLAHMPHHLGQ